MGSRNKRKERCAQCRLHLESCVCTIAPRLRLSTRVVVCAHHRELAKTTATGPLIALTCEPSEVRVHGLRDGALDLSDLVDPARRLALLFPSEEAALMSPEWAASDPRPLTLVVPEGNWRQASRMARRLPGIERAEKVMLPPGGNSDWGVRKETRLGGLATFEAVARALGILESKEAETRLMEFFHEVVARTFESRGQQKEAPPAAPLASDPHLSILYQDEDLVVVDKPSGALVHRGWGRDARPVLQILRDQIGRRVYPVHRLDRGTSGCLLFALSSGVAKELSGMFQSGAVEKEYWAITRGGGTSEVLVDHPLAHRKLEIKKPARTRLEWLARSGAYGLVLARPETGRPHQIRKHLKHIARPIIGDVRYGKGEHNRHFREQFGFHRLALHLKCLSFAHPVTGLRVSIRADLPPVWRSTHEMLGFDLGLID